MKAFRAGVIPLLASLAFVSLQPAHADVRTLSPVQRLTKPATPAYDAFGVGVAIDGPHLVVLALKEETTPGAGHTYAALLYRRNNSDGRWVYRRTLVSTTGYFARMDVRMQNNLAAINFGGQVYLFEYSNGDYRPAQVATAMRHPGGVSISRSRLLVGGDNCDYDAVVYEKGSNGVWNITGRLDDDAGGCDTEGLQVELNYDYAILRPKHGGVGTAWRRNGTALNWLPSGQLDLPPETALSDKPYTQQMATALTNGGHVFRRSDTSTWTLVGRATSVDHDNSFGVTFETQYRDDVLVTSESGTGHPFPRIYLETSPGNFEHVASLWVNNNSSEIDISQRTVVVVVRDPSGDRWEVEIFTLPEPLRPPAQIVNDFELRDISDFTFNSGQFALATRGADDVLAQSSNTLAIALLTASEWSEHQEIEADITATFNGSDSWAGLVTRYVDPNNYYFVTLKPNDGFAAYKRVNGVDTLLREDTLGPGSGRRHVVFTAQGNWLYVTIDGAYFPLVTDDSLPRGRAGLATWQARADFDDVRAAGASTYRLFHREWGPWGTQIDVDMNTAGGNWQIPEIDYNTIGLKQTDTSGDARAWIGTPVANQDLRALVRLDSFRASSQGAWFGLLARYVDPQNHYYVTVRSTGQLQIRKMVNGTITVLATANYTAVPGQTFELGLRVINDQLQAFVDGELVASAYDSSIASGQYGFATYRAAATWDTFSVAQP